MLGRIIRKLCN